MKKTAFLFPGQGSQFVGMGRDLIRDFPPAVRLFEAAGDESGEDIANLSINGPFEALSRTRVLQPAITAMNLACAAWLEDAGVTASACAGHSLGEIAALACAKVLTPVSAIRLAAIRGRLMDDAAQARPGTMFAVVGLPLENVSAVMERDIDPTEGSVANINADNQIVISGTTSAMAKAIEILENSGARTVELAVSGAWHSPLMSPAVAPWKKALDQMTFNEPAVPIFHNVTGSPANDVAGLKAALIDQLIRPVRWTTCVDGLFKSGVDRFVEVGPGKVLRGTLRRIIEDSTTYEIHTTGDIKSLQRVADVFTGS